MTNLPAKIPRTALDDLHQAFVPEGTLDESSLELSIRVACGDIAIRDLSAYLDIIDRVYGRLSEKGLISYARKEHGHLKINDMRQGSWELLIREAVTSGYSHALIIVYLAIKYLPPAIQSIAVAYNNYEQGRLARINRKRIKAEMENDIRLKNLSNNRMNQLARLIEYLHERESEKINRAIKFARKGLLDVEIRIKKESEK